MKDMVNQCIKYDTEESWTYKLSREYLAKHANEMLKKECPKYGITYIDTSKNRQEVLKDTLEKIMKG